MIISAKLIKNPRTERYCYWCPGSMVNVPIVRVFVKWPEGDMHTIFMHWDCMIKHQSEIKEKIR